MILNEHRDSLIFCVIAERQAGASLQYKILLL